MNFKILGPLEAESDGELVDLGARKQRSLFGLLLVNHNRVVVTDRILEELWGDDAHGKENALWVYISRLRSVLDEHSSQPVLLTKDHGYSVVIDPDSLDAHVFEELASKGAGLLRTDPQAAADTLAEALGLWRGNPLEDFSYDEWARPHIARLTELRNQCLGDRIEADLKRGLSGELIGELERLVDERTLDERPVSQLMLAQYRAGRQADALRCFERYRRRAGEELGIDPSPELRRLEEQILLHDTRLQTSATRSETVAARHTSGANPFKGLEAFTEQDTDLFFGRDTLVSDILARVTDHRIVSIVGPSGSGKSSAVRSGVIPALRKNAIAGSDMWAIASMTPGSHPYIELEATLLRASLDAPDSLRDQLDGSPDEILRAVLRVSPNADSTVVIMIDQFEELFTMSNEATANRFLTALSEAAADPRGRIRIIVTLRADFYDRPLGHAAFGSAMSRGVVNVVPMAPEELEQAASKPATTVGVRLEPELEAALIGDVLGQPGALPLFQFALTDLFDRRVGDTLTLASYRDIGGVDGSVGRKAEHIYENLTANQQAAARQIFLRLVSITDVETRSRRRVEGTELLDLDLEVTDLQTVIDLFGKDRLLSFDRNDATGSPTVEVAHEALLEHWKRLADWIEVGSEDVRMNVRLRSAASEWSDSGKDPGYLLAGARLGQYETWARTSIITLARTERLYVDASTDLRDATARAEQERQDRESAIARRAKRNALGLMAVVVMVAAVGGFFLWTAIQPEGPSVALVRTSDIDKGVNAMILTGFEQAEFDLGFKANDVVILADMESTMRQLAEDGTDLIVAGLGFETFVGEIAQDYPETTFAIVALPLPFDDENVAVAQYIYGDSDYLAGVTASLSSRTGVVGIVGGAHNEFLSQSVAAFEAGVKDTDGDVDVLIGWVSEVGDGEVGFFDSDVAHDAATDLYQRGADVLYSAAIEASSGVIRAASDYTEQTGTQVWAIGSEQDEGFLAEDDVAGSILTSMVIRYDVAVYSIVSAYLDGTLEKVMTFDMANGGLNYSDYGGNIDDVRGQIDAAKSRLALGEVTVPTATAARSVWRGETDGTLDVVYDGSSCVVSGNYVIAADDVVAFTFKNNTDAKAGLGIGRLPDGVTRDLLEDEAGATGADFIDLNLSYALALFNNGGIPTSSWSVPSRASAEIRAAFPGAAEDFAAVSCFSELGVQFAELIPIR